ncbi:VCBS repeat-containing protein [Neolewinella persica]|uniref:VCBS repeat-containing protein n=1 Tax=Neolewinella persica TaxID=70998 RepID=UPI00038267EC|nr:VCBS repeat-containing protein [Neolewinella persica]
MQVFSTFSTLLFLVILTGCAQDEGKNQGYAGSEQPLFKLLNSEETGVTFANNIVEDEQYNHLRWNHVYSGAGVATGDINNDGLPDLFFSGNQVGDQLYLNKGNLKFENITLPAGIVQEEKWSTGVTFADVNNDGFLDIYVCRNDPTMDFTQRKNRLYVNNGDNTFTDRAEEMGMADMGFSIQATFFDYDNDGDLDCYVVNQPPDGRFVSRFNLDLEEGKAQWTDHFYKNLGNGKFQDITRTARIENYGYGLNVVANDLNNDGYTDLYVTNDYYEPDFLYLNNGDGTFRNDIDASIRHISNFSMGSDIGDFNNDGEPDIGVVDMAAPDHFRSKTNMASMRPKQFWQLVEDGNHYQYMANTLQMNNGNGSFSEIGFQAGIAKTDWSWSFLMADFDNDGFRDFALTNGIKRDMRNNDFQYKIKQLNEQGQTEFNVMDVIQMVPSVPISNYVYHNDGTQSNGEQALHFTDVTAAWGFDLPGFSNGMAVADLDNDGDLDAVINNVSAPASVYENTQGNQDNYVRFDLGGKRGYVAGMNAKVTIQYAGDKIQTTEITATRGYLSASETVAHFGVGEAETIEELRIRWPNGKWTIEKNLAVNQTHLIDPADAKGKETVPDVPHKLLEELNPEVVLKLTHQENKFDDFAREILLPHKQSEHGPHLATGDVNGDGREDFYFGGAAGTSGQLMLQREDGHFVPAAAQPWNADKASEDLGSLFFDADGDGDADLYVVSGGSEFNPNDKRYLDRLYRNDGKGSFKRDPAALPQLFGSGEAVAAADYDGDGDLDLFVGGRLIPGKYPTPTDSYLLENNSGKFTDATSSRAPDLTGLGMVTDALFSDYDGDGDPDLLVVGEWMKIRVFANEAGTFTDQTDRLGLADSKAWWWSIAAGDFDEDGDQDYLVGNLGRNTKYKASREKPLMVYGNDFDENGTNDVVLASYSGDQIVPVRGRECSSEQMPFIAEKFPSYEGFATSGLEGILPENTLEKAVKEQVYSFESILLKNEGDRFERIALPARAQTAPLRDFMVFDLDGDGHLDVLGTGNMYGAEVETSRYDAGIGLTLIGDGQGGFRALGPRQSGWFTPFDARSINALRTGDGTYLLVGNNNDRLQVFVRKEGGR